MTIEQFSQSDFEKVLTDAQLKWCDLGWLVGDERGYKIMLDEHSSIKIRSSIHSDGKSASVGDDSIRCWLQTESGESIISKSASQKLQSEHYITRVPGWQERLVKKIEYLRLLKLNIGNCRECASPRIVLVSRTPKNPGRLFSKCSQCGAWGNWLNVETLEDLGKQTSLFGGQIGKSTASETQDWKVLTGAKTVKRLPLDCEETLLNEIAPSEKVLGSENISNVVTKSNLEKNSDSFGSVESQPPASNGFTNGLVGFLESESLKTEEVTPIIAKKEFTPSLYQIAIRDFVLNESDALRVEAYAGSGKTSTNAFVCRALPEKSGNVKMMVFSKANQLDMQAKIPEWIPATTTHSAGFADIRHVYKNVKVDECKTLNIFKSEYEFDYAMRENYPQVAKLVSLCKNTLALPNDTTLDELCERYDVITNGQREQIYDAVARILKISTEQTQVVDFDDMPYLPALGIVPVAPVDLLFVDEYQDNNFTQETYYLKTGARIIFVGDAKQAIYGFRGAQIGAMDKMQAKLNAKQLPLPISYRCAKSIIALAQTIVPQIQAREDAPDGLVSYNGKLSMVKPGDMVLCRNNAPLVKPCFELIRNGVKATIKGRDIGTNLMNLVKKVEKKTFSSSFIQLLGAIQDYTDTESAKLDLQHRESQAASLRDQCETIMALSESCHSTQDLQKRIDTIFSESNEGVVFSTSHRSKGMESKRIFVLKPELLQPQKYDTQSWQIEQLNNLRYVTITRAMEELYFIQE